ncbi:MAG: hypothetical protein ACC653_14145 [Gammaproteobacteria bacterium]
MSSRLLSVIVVLSIFLPNTAYSWVYSEHRDIAIQTVKILPEKYRTDLDNLWRDSRIGFEKRLCENAANSTPVLNTTCLDWAAFSAIAGDHSCSSNEMLDFILNENWLLEIANVSAQLKVKLDSIPVENFNIEQERIFDNSKTISEQIKKHQNRAIRLNALRTADTKLLRADPLYATRASSNTAHFLIARPASQTTIRDYAKLALSSGANINAMGVYSLYHIYALQKASRLANEPQLSKKQQQQITRSMLADEAFALHFLEDVFAAGHVAGTWGEVSQRLGTHNYYNQNGIETYTWNRDLYPIVLMGDAHMRQQDEELAAKTISISLKQLLDIVNGTNPGYEYTISPFAANSENFNVCTQNHFPQHTSLDDYKKVISETISNTPIPGLSSEYGSLPRFRSEVGSFIGLAGSIDLRVSDGGYLDFQTNKGKTIGLDLSFRAGFGMDGVMNESGDGLVFVSLGFRSDTASSNNFIDSLQSSDSGTFSAAIPARTGVSFRFRMPFYLIPTDLFWMSPMYLFNETAYTNMAVTAGNGGLIPWQQGMATTIGRFQFVLGREIGVTLYGRNNTDELIIPDNSATEPLRLAKFKSILVDLPILEYRPYRSFASNQSSSVTIQLYTSADIPHDTEPVVINGLSQPLHTVWSVGLRLVFDWRHY